MPSGRFAANAAWLAVQTMAHNLARWTAHIGLGEQIVTAKTLRRRFFSLDERLTRSARLITLHLPLTQRPRQLALSRSECPIPPSRSPQPLQAAIGAPKSACRPPANLPSTRIRARIIAPVAPSPPSAVLTPSIRVHRWIRAWAGSWFTGKAAKEVMFRTYLPIVGSTHLMVDVP